MSEDIPDDVQQRFAASQAAEPPPDVQARFAASQQAPQVPMSGGAPEKYSATNPNPYADNETGILHAFGQGFGEATGPTEQLGLSDESVEWLRKAGYFAGPDSSRLAEPFQGFFEGIVRPAAAALDSAWRASQGVFRGLQTTAVAAGVPTDWAALPEAFAGSPGALERPRPSVVPAPIRPVEGAPPVALTRSAAAHTGIPEVDAVLHSPTTQSVIDNAVIDRSHTVPYMAGGSTPLADPTVYIDKHVPKEQTAPRLSLKGAPIVAHRVDAQAIETSLPPPAEGLTRMWRGNRPGEVGKNPVFTNDLPGIALPFRQGYGGPVSYVDVPTADLAKYENKAGAALGAEFTLPKELAAQAKPIDFTPTPRTVTFDPAEPWTVHENVEQHTMELLTRGGMTDAEAYRVAHFEFAEKAEQAWYRAHDIDQVAAEKEQATWLPRIQHEDATDIPENLYDKPYPHANVKGAQHESVEEARPTPEEVARAKDIIRNAKELQPPDVAGDMQQARELGVIGPEKPPITEGAPAQAAKNAIPPRVPPGAPEPPEPPPERSPWRQRFDQFVGKLKTPEDVKALIQHSADEAEEFPTARRGDIPLAQAEALSEASGIPASDLDLRGIGRLLKNDNEVRTAMQLMLKTGDDLHLAMQQVAAKGGRDDLAELTALQEARMRHSLAVEQIAGLRAEWGRTGNVFQEFQEASKEAQTLGKFLADKKGESVDDLRELAKRGAALDPRTELPGFMNAARKPTTFLDKLHWYWVNGLISGLITHTGYGMANYGYAMSIHGVATPLAAVIGAAERAAGITAKDEGAFFGEALAGVAGFHLATPTAFITAARAAKAGLKTPLEAERTLVDAALARGEKPPKALARNVEASETPQERPIGGKLGRAIGLPGDMAGAIHGFYKIAGYDASIAAQAYRQAVKEGLGPFSTGFADRVDFWRKNPTEAMMQKGIDDAYAGTFMGELGPIGKAFNEFVKKLPGARWVFPFRHIPVNLLKATYEWSPAAFFDKDMRANLMGENGAAARQLAASKMIIGSAVMGHFFNLYMNGQSTGEYPDDPKEREAWRLAGKQPNSLLVGDEWWSMQRLGPLAQVAMMGANLGRVVEGYQGGQDQAMVIATTRLAEAAGHFVSDAPGFQTLQNYFESRNDPKKWTRFVASEAGTLLPYSSFEKQAASFTDPYMREVKTFLDGIKYSIPGERQSLLPKRDWSGQPVENPGFESVIRAGHAITDPVDQELGRLGINAGPPRDIIGGVKLPPQLYDQYQATAGPYTRAALTALVTNPNWGKMPAFQQAAVMRATMAATRRQAQAAMQMAHPELIQAGVQAKVNRVLGQPAPALSH